MSAQIEISDFITIIRPQFMTFCKDACRSATFNHMLFRIAWKCKDQPKEKIQSGDVLWYAKNEQITNEMSNAWGVCKVRQEVEALIKMNLIGKRKNPAWGADRTKHFCFGSEQCEVFLKHCENNNICVVHLDLPVEVKHLIYSSVANDTSIKCCCERSENAEANDKCIDSKSYNHQMVTIDVSDGNDESIKAIPKNTTKTTTEEHTEESVPAAVESSATSATASADRDARTLSQSFDTDMADTIRSRIPEGDAILLERMHNGNHRIYRKSGRPIGELIPVGMDVSAGLLELITVDAPTTSTPLQVESAKVALEKTTKPAGGRKSTKPAEPEFTPGGRKVKDAWASLFKSPPDVGPKTILCANALYEKLMPWCYELKLTCKELLGDIKDWLFANQGDYYHRRGVKLCDVGREFEGWQSAKEDEMRNPNRQEPTPHKSSTRATSTPKDEDMVMWWDQQTGQQRLMTYAEADENGWEGGFGEFIQHTNYGRTVTV